MINVILNGACGRLGTTFQKVITDATDVNIVAGVDVNRTGISTNFPLYKNIKNVAVPADAVVDFSTPAALSDVLEYCVGNNLKLLVATTGHSEIQNEKIATAAKKIAVFKAANLSHGVYVLSRLVALAASLLDGFDVNVTETHHKKKLDAPSGTAKMLADVIKSSCVDENTPDVSINSIRGGTAVGKHEISFFGNYETLTLTHEACCKDVYAVGALRALRFLMTKKVGLFSSSDL